MSSLSGVPGCCGWSSMTSPVSMHRDSPGDRPCAGGGRDGDEASRSVYASTDLPCGIVAVGAFAELAFPAPTVFVYEERKHAWVIMPTHVERLARRGVWSGIEAAMLVQSQKQQLDELGYLVLPGFVPPELLTELRKRVESLWEREGDNAGSEFRIEPGTRRLANLVDKGAVFADLVTMPEILECIEHVIGP